MLTAHAHWSRHSNTSQSDTQQFWRQDLCRHRTTSLEQSATQSQDYVGCHSASSGGYWRHFCLENEATVQCELFLTAPNRNILTYPARAALAPPRLHSMPLLSVGMLPQGLVGKTRKLAFFLITTFFKLSAERKTQPSTTQLQFPVKLTWVCCPTVCLYGNRHTQTAVVLLVAERVLQLVDDDVGC